MSSIVVDASIAFAWVLSTQRTQASEALRALANVDFIAPFVFKYELRNGLRKAENEKRISFVDADQAVSELDTVIDILDPPDDTTIDQTMTLARRLTTSFYDACYLELALRTGSTLATRDGLQVQAGQKVGVRVYDGR